MIAQPRLQVTENKKNFGSVKQGEVVTGLFEIKNTGNQPLVITDWEVACSCTTVDYPELPVLPGNSATITVTFNTKSAYGKQDRIATVESNDPKSPVKLHLKGTVVRE